MFVRSNSRLLRVLLCLAVLQLQGLAHAQSPSPGIDVCGLVRQDELQGLLLSDNVQRRGLAGGVSCSFVAAPVSDNPAWGLRIVASPAVPREHAEAHWPGLRRGFQGQSDAIFNDEHELGPHAFSQIFRMDNGSSRIDFTVLKRTDGGLGMLILFSLEGPRVADVQGRRSELRRVVGAVMRRP